MGASGKVPDDQSGKKHFNIVALSLLSNFTVMICRVIIIFIILQIKVHLEVA